MIRGISKRVSVSDARVLALIGFVLGVVASALVVLILRLIH